MKHFSKGFSSPLELRRGKGFLKAPLLTVKYFFDVLDAEVWRTLLYRELDLEGDVLNHPGYLQEAYEAGKDLALTLRATPSP